ncbi:MULTISPECIES: hypothetical protein [Bacillus cereus group]|uniref:hypothetical protein n=1 Tax=Bacillus cereus group TaxID=86661 RepID=UPI0022E77811|nr:hypothetical protein [Bacillus cereus group sp. TH152-1LC]MDA1675667.1 hypothetical protein [Bacillus cereus group sp. TH152-1LC]
MEMTISMELAEKALTEEEIQNLKKLYDKVEAYKEKLKLKKGDKLKRKRDGKIFTYVDRAPYGFNNAYVEELEHYVHLSDFEKVITD